MGQSWNGPLAGQVQSRCPKVATSLRFKRTEHKTEEIVALNKIPLRGGIAHEFLRALPGLGVESRRQREVKVVATVKKKKKEERGRPSDSQVFSSTAR